MIKLYLSLRRCGRLAGLLAAVLPLLFSASRMYASDYQKLSVVKPAISCESLGKIDISQAVGEKTVLQTAVVDTPKGQYCKITGTFAPEDGFEVDLPLEHWTQRFVEPGCGGDCGMIRASIGNASSCAPALNGEFAVAHNNLGHDGSKQYPGGWASDPLKRLDMIYLGNHYTALATKALIKAFYGQGPKYSYFMGCSDGGREALVAAERYPNDYDGISAGAPVMLFTLQNTITKMWEIQANTRADGTKTLTKARGALLHDAVVAHCDTMSGVKDGQLEDPRTCKFDPTWIQCKAGVTDTASCLTAEEVGVAQKLYSGAIDAQGRQLTLSGYMLGSEPNWQLPNSSSGNQGGPGGPGGPAKGPNNMLKYMTALTPLADDDPWLNGKFGFDEASLNHVAETAPLWTGANTNLRPFQTRGGKLILWHGLADVSVAPWVSIAYYQGVQKEMGEHRTDSFLRLFLIPGVSHCGGGLGFQQIDLLTPLMAWTEKKEAPKMLMTSIPKNLGGSGGPGGPGGPRTARPPAMPYASAPQPATATRPVFPYPFIAHYTGHGDPNDATNFQPVKSPAPVPYPFNSLAMKLIGPNNQKWYQVKNGVLVVDDAK